MSYDQKAYDRRYYLEHRERKIAAAKARNAAWRAALSPAELDEYNAFRRAQAQARARARIEAARKAC